MSGCAEANRQRGNGEPLGLIDSLIVRRRPRSPRLATQVLEPRRASASPDPRSAATSRSATACTQRWSRASMPLRRVKRISLREAGRLYWLAPSPSVPYSFNCVTICLAHGRDAVQKEQMTYGFLHLPRFPPHPYYSLFPIGIPPTTSAPGPRSGALLGSPVALQLPRFQRKQWARCSNRYEASGTAMDGAKS